MTVIPREPSVQSDYTKQLRPMIKYWRKLAFQKLISLLPYPVHTHERLKRILGYGISNIDDFEEWTLDRIEVGIDNLRFVESKTGMSIRDKTILNIGTGWNAIDLMLMYILGAKRIYTLDIHDYIKREILKTEIEIIESNIRKISKKFDRDGNYLKKRVEEIKNRKKGKEKLMSSMNCRNIIRFPIHLGISEIEEEVDLCHSVSTLHRIPKLKLSKLLAAIARVTKQSGHTFHRLTLADFNTRPGLNDAKWELEYLTYPDWLWRFVCSEKISWNNRLREKQLINMFNKEGLHERYIESRYRPDNIEKIRSTRLNTRFKSLSPIENAIHESRVIFDNCEPKKGCERRMVKSAKVFI